VYFVVYYSVLVGVYTDLKVAQERLESFNEFGLLQFYIILHRRMQNWEEIFWTFYSYLESYRDYLSFSPEMRQAMHGRFESITEILGMDIVDALTSLLKGLESDEDKEERGEEVPKKKEDHLMRYYLELDSVYPDRAIRKLRN